MKIHMKTLVYFSLCLIIITTIFWIYQRFFSDSIEGFTPKIREVYRPYVRKIRIFSENFYNNSIENVSTFFRKMGVI